MILIHSMCKGFCEESGTRTVLQQKCKTEGCRWMCCIAMADQKCCKMGALHCNGGEAVAMADGMLQWRMECCNGGWDVAMADRLMQWRTGCCKMADGMLQWWMHGCNGRWDVARCRWTCARKGATVRCNIKRSMDYCERRNT